MRVSRYWLIGHAAILAALLQPWLRTAGAADRVEARFDQQVRPILEDYCFACHGNGLKKGGVTLDGLASDGARLHDGEFWWAVLKNVRSGIMPPAGKPRPSEKEQQLLEDWIKSGAFGLDPDDPDPGRVTVRRLNRVEYRNTIRELMGVDFDTTAEFPPDDTGHGFDTIGDVLTLSPMLLEKYLLASRSIVAQAVPMSPRAVTETDDCRSTLSPRREPGRRQQRGRPALLALLRVGEGLDHVRGRACRPLPVDPGPVGNRTLRRWRQRLQPVSGPLHGGWPGTPPARFRAARRPDLPLRNRPSLAIRRS